MVRVKDPQAATIERVIRHPLIDADYSRQVAQRPGSRLVIHLTNAMRCAPRWFSGLGMAERWLRRVFFHNCLLMGYCRGANSVWNEVVGRAAFVHLNCC